MKISIKAIFLTQLLCVMTSIDAMETRNFERRTNFKRSKSASEPRNSEDDCYQLNKDKQLLELQLKLVEEGRKKEENMSKYFRHIFKQTCEKLTVVETKNRELSSGNQCLLEELKSLRKEVDSCNQVIFSQGLIHPTLFKETLKIVQILGDENPKLKKEIARLQRENTTLSRKNAKAVTFLKERLENNLNDSHFKALLPEIIKDVSMD